MGKDVKEDRETKRRAGLKLWRRREGLSCRLSSWAERPGDSRMPGGEPLGREDPGGRAGWKQRLASGWNGSVWPSGPAQTAVSPGGRMSSLPLWFCCAKEAAKGQVIGAVSSEKGRLSGLEGTQLRYVPRSPVSLICFIK